MNPLRHACLASLAALAAGCGGATDDIDTAASTAPVGAPRVAMAAPPASTAAAAAGAQASDATAGKTMPLQAWLSRFATARGVVATADAAIAQQPVAATVQPPATADELVAALRGVDVVLGYAARGDGPPRLSTVRVQPPGPLARPAAQAAVPPGHPGSAAATATVDDPVQAMQRVQQELASSNATVRIAALARSFELEAPLPAPTLVAALQGDASGEVRLYALLALARHPAVTPPELRVLLQAARADADPAVRARAGEFADQLDALARTE